jgi:hypothetical protein
LATGYFNRAIPALKAAVSGPAPPLDSGWLELGKYMSLSIMVEGLEAGGSVKITGFNGGKDGKENLFPDPLTEFGAPINAGSLPAGGVITTNGCYFIGGAFTFGRAIKTPGGVPTATNVTFSGQIPK